MTEFQVNTFVNNSQSNSTVAIDPNGNFVISWQSFGQDGDSNGIYAQRYNSAGVAQGVEFRVNSTTSGDQNNPTGAIDADGDFVISWTGQDASGSGIYAQRYNSAGVAQGSEFRVNSTTSGDQNNSTIAIDAVGDFVISWTGQDASGSGIYAQRYNSAGVAQGSEFRVNSTTSGDQNSSTVAVDANGDFVVSWQSYGQDGDYYGIYAQRYNSAGVAQGSEFQVNTTTTTTRYQLSPTIAIDAGGDFVISWQSLGQDGSGYGIYAQRYNSAGVAQGSEFQVNNTTIADQKNPTVAMDANGDFVISWQSYGQDGDNNGIYARRYNSSGVAQGSEFLVNDTTTDNQNNPSVAIAADGNFVISWQSFGQDGSSDGIYAQLYRNNGAPPIVTSGSASALAYIESHYSHRFRHHRQ
ncbi:hypothetical protein [Nostoc sp.]|uniref:hypothetical protein n=1 Tax=Nostoc sp. TaxID=1180 RepID=UPI002FF9B671